MRPVQTHSMKFMWCTIFENEKSFAQREQLASGTLQKAGYYTVDFDTKVSLKKGERYAVLVYLKTPGTKHPMAIEYDTGEKFYRVWIWMTERVISV